MTGGTAGAGDFHKHQNIYIAGKRKVDVQMKRIAAVVVIAVICFAFMFAIIMASTVAPETTDNPSKYSYITLKNVTIDLVNEQATITANYTIDEGVSLLVSVMGKDDLRSKLTTMLNFEEDIHFIAVDTDHMTGVIYGASFDYGDGSYWFSEHEFGILIPELIVNTPQASRNYTQTRVFPDGIGYFST